MLLETRGLVTDALFFGTASIVNAAGVFTILASVLEAGGLATRLKLPARS